MFDLEVEFEYGKYLVTAKGKYIPPEPYIGDEILDFVMVTDPPIDEDHKDFKEIEEAAIDELFREVDISKIKEHYRDELGT